jgi:hypothetical protein
LERGTAVAAPRTLQGRMPLGGIAPLFCTTAVAAGFGRRPIAAHSGDGPLITPGTDFSRDLTQQGDANPTLSVYRVLSALIPTTVQFARGPELAIMSGRASKFIAGPSIGRWAKQTRSAARALWVRLREAFDAYRQWRAAEAVYTELSRLSDAELERRGIAHGDLGRLISELDERR